MSALKIATIALLYLQCDALYWHTKTITAPMNELNGQTLVFDMRTFTDPRVLYAICRAAGDRRKTCDIYRFRHIYGKEQVKKYKCSVTIEAKKRGSSIGDKVRLVPLGENRAIVAYLERTNLQTYLGLISVRHTDCKLHELPEIYQIDRDVNDKPYELELLALPANDTTYHVVYRNSRLCGDDYCALRVDPVNNIIHGPKKWFNTGFDRHQQVVDLVPFRAKFYRFLILEFGHGKSQFSLINEHSDLKILDNHKRHTDRNSYKTSWTLAYTTANERNGICNLLDSTLSCFQYDESGVKVYHSEDRYNENDDVWVSAMHNLPDGNGILVLLIEHVPNRYKILRFDKNGNKVGWLYVEQFDCDWRENAIAGQFFEADDGYCVSLACYDTGDFSEAKKNRGNVKIVTERFLLEDFELFLKPTPDAQ